MEWMRSEWELSTSSETVSGGRGRILPRYARTFRLQRDHSCAHAVSQKIVAERTTEDTEKQIPQALSTSSIPDSKLSQARRYSVCGVTGCSPSFRRKFSHTEERICLGPSFFAVRLLWRQGRLHRNSTRHVARRPPGLLAKWHRGGSAQRVVNHDSSSLVLQQRRAPMPQEVLDLVGPKWFQGGPISRSDPSGLRQSSAQHQRRCMLSGPPIQFGGVASALPKAGAPPLAPRAEIRV